MAAMLKRMPERALKSRESFQVSFSGTGKIRIAEKTLRFRRLAGFPETFCKQADCITVHAEQGA